MRYRCNNFEFCQLVSSEKSYEKSAAKDSGRGRPRRTWKDFLGAMPKKNLSGMDAAFKKLIAALVDKAPDLEQSINESTDLPESVTARSYIQAAQSALSCFALTSNFKFISEEGNDVTEDIQKHITTVRKPLSS